MTLVYEKRYERGHDPIGDERMMLALNSQRGFPTLPEQRQAIRDDLVAMLSKAIFGEAVSSAPHVLMRGSSAPMAMAKESLAEQCCWYLRRFGVPGGMSSKGMLRTALQAAMNPRDFDPWGPDAGYIALSMSSTDIPSVLADAIGKSAAYLSNRLTPSSAAWAPTVLCDRTSGKHVSVNSVGYLDEVAEGDDIEHVFVSDEGESFSIKHRANIIGISREALVSDDLRALDPVKAFVGAEAMTIDRLVYGVLTTNAATADSVAYFATAHNNLGTGALTVANVGALLRLVAAQENARGQDMLMRAGFIITPLSLGMTASQLCGSQIKPDLTEGGFVLKPIIAPELDATSTAQWYVVNDPASAAPAVVVARPRQYPNAELKTRVRFDDDCMQFKYSLWATAAPGSWKCAARSSGS
jgi:hypothetical protein